MGNAWTFVLTIGWTFVPGVVAFHPSAEQVAGESFCGAWATVFTARLSCVLTIVFFFPNFLTVVRWLTDNILHSPGFCTRILEKAKFVDDNLMGLPLTQVLVKAFLLRGTSEVASVQLAVTLHDKEQLQRDRVQMQEQL